MQSNVDYLMKSSVVTSGIAIQYDSNLIRSFIVSVSGSCSVSRYQLSISGERSKEKRDSSEAVVECTLVRTSHDITLQSIHFHNPLIQ